MKIQVVMVGPVVSKQGPKASYSVFELIYKYGDKTGNKNIMEFQKAAFAALKDAQQGDWFDVTTEKSADGKYTNWTAVVPSTADAPSAVSAAKAPSSGSTGRASGGWQGETAEERAARQVMIVRQSSAATAERFVSATRGSDGTVQDLLIVAKQIEAYVFGKSEEPDLDVEVD